MDNEMNTNENVQQAVTNALAEEKKKKKKKKWIIIGSILIVLIIISAAFGSGNGSDSDNKSSVQSIQSSDSAEISASAEAQKIEAGTEVSTKSLKISYLSCNPDYTDYNEYLGPKDGYRVIRAEFEFENISSTDQYISGTECYADNSKCELFFGSDDASFDAINTISPGRKVSAAVYYEVPENAENIELEIDGDFWSNEKIIFIVK